MPAPSAFEEAADYVVRVALRAHDYDPGELAEGDIGPSWFRTAEERVGRTLTADERAAIVVRVNAELASLFERA